MTCSRRGTVTLRTGSVPFVAPITQPGLGQCKRLARSERTLCNVLCLVGHAGNPGHEFNENRTGLDHLEFIVAQREDLVEWAVRLDELGVEHSTVKEFDYTANSMITFRDPDNIQLEFFWRARPTSDARDSDQSTHIVQRNPRDKPSSTALSGRSRPIRASCTWVVVGCSAWEVVVAGVAAVVAD